MDPTQQSAPTAEELHLAAVEQALIDPEAREIETKNQLATLLSSFQQLELLIQELKPAKTLKSPLTDITPIWLTLPHLH